MGLFAHAAAVRLRAALLWLTVTTATLCLGRLCLPEARVLPSRPGTDFTTLLVQVCAAATICVAVWLWLVTTQVVLAVVRTPGCARSRRAGRVRSALVAACGVAALASTATAGAAGQDGPGPPQLPAQVLDGLPLPDRVTDGPRRAADQAHAAVRVRPGDSLWAIAARRLGPTADVADVATYWRRIHDLNAAVIGPDPDLVQPGQHLRLPHI